MIRLAEQLERSRDRSIRAVSVGTANGTVELQASTAPDGDPSVPIWAARQSSGLLAEAVGRPVEIHASARLGSSAG